MSETKSFRVVLTYGQFRMWTVISDKQAFQPIYVMKPLGNVDMATAMVNHKDIPTDSIKKMRFEYKHRLDYDLLEYSFAGEE